ncbi:splicing factor U2af-associated protein 2, partial [Tanacetum coccineum]
EANQPPDSWFELKVNTHVYVTGLPEDVTFDEVVEVFSKSPLRFGDKVNMSVTPAKFEQKGKNLEVANGWVGHASQDPFSLAGVCGNDWRNTDRQLSFLKYAISAAPEVFTFAHCKRQLV